VTPLSPAAVLALVPHRPPIRFLSEILELDAERIRASYTWTEEDCEGHFREFKVVPGVKIIEFAAQAGCVAWGIYHLSRTVPADEIRHYIGLFTRVEDGALMRVVRPGCRVEAEATFGESGFFRGNKIVSEVTVRFSGGPDDGDEVFRGRLHGVWVPRASLEGGGGEDLS
jgi:3-hydroxyacyl-[acyl-carrier-protein] dehydratase